MLLLHAPRSQTDWLCESSPLPLHGAGGMQSYASSYASLQGFGGRRPPKNVFVVRDFASFAGKISHDKVGF